MKTASYERKKSRAGLFFILPWIIGTALFFIKPVIESILYSVGEIKLTDTGYMIDFIGLEHYSRAFTRDPEFIRKIVETLPPMIYQVPLIVILSLFLALLINQKFVGRVFVRAALFLPVIVANGVIISIIRGDAFSQMLMQNVSANQLFNGDFLRIMLTETEISPSIITFIANMVDSVFNLIWKSGIQILIFLAGLQTISPQMYEAAKIESGTSWEIFWKVTFPMITPMLILNLIYTIIDSFTDYSNTVMLYVNKLSFDGLEYSAAMAWIYFAFVLVIIGITYLLCMRQSKKYL